MDQAWLASVWKRLDKGWIRRFWENEKGKRATWLNVIAEADGVDKQGILDLLTEQLRFRELWASVPGVRMRRGAWGKEPYYALNALLKSFYAPLFYSSHGYSFGDGPLDASAKKIDRRDLNVFIAIPANEEFPACPNYL